MKLCFDYGHGGRDPGASYGGRREADDVLSLGREIAIYLRRQGVEVHETRTSDKSVELWERAQFEKKNHYDYFISFHRNAYRPEVANGAETFVYLKGSPKAYKLAQDIQDSLEALGFRNRGVKKENFYVLRNTRAPALLIELGFIDQTKDNQLFDCKRFEMVKSLGDTILRHIT